jgi:hypothetical protein
LDAFMVILLSLSAIALFVPVFSGYVLGLVMILIAIVTWRSGQFNKQNSQFMRFFEALLPVSRSAVIFWLSLVLASIGAALISDSFDLREARRSLGNFFVKYILLWFAYLSFWWRLGGSDRHWSVFSFAYAIVSFINASYCLMQRQLGIDWAHGFGSMLGENRLAYGVYRVSGFMGHPLSLAYCQILALIGAVHFIQRSTSNWVKFSWSISAICSFFVLFISGSRGPQVIALAGVLLMIPVDLWRKRGALISLSMLIFLILGMGLGVFERFLELFKSGFGGDMRLAHWTVHWRVFMDHVWFGLGPGAPKSAISTYYSAIQANDNIKLAHNAFLQCAADFGLVGFSGLIVWLTAWIRVATRMSDAKRVLIVLFVLSALGGLTQNNLQESAYVLGLTTWTMIITSIEVGTRERSIRTVENQNHLARKGAATN